MSEYLLNFSSIRFWGRHADSTTFVKTKSKNLFLDSFYNVINSVCFSSFFSRSGYERVCKVFYNINNLNLMKGRYEIGFLRYAEMLHKIAADPGILLIVSSAICISTACVLTYKFSKNPILSMMLYILLGSYFSQMNVMRQAIVLSLMEVSFMVLLKNNGGTESHLCPPYSACRNIPYCCNRWSYPVGFSSPQ